MQEYVHLIGSEALSESLGCLGHGLVEPNDVKRQQAFEHPQQARVVSFARALIHPWAPMVLRGYHLHGWRVEHMSYDLTVMLGVNFGLTSSDFLEHLQDLSDVALLRLGLRLQARR